MNLEGKHIIITGAGGGIGRAIALACADAGAQLALFDKTQADAEHACADIKNAKAYALDLANAESAEAKLNKAVADMGQLDGLVLNAAHYAPDDALPSDTSLDCFATTLAVNVIGHFALCRAALPHMLGKGGSIVTLSSVVARAGSASAQIAYTTSKGALESMTREIAIAYARDNIRANCVAPGPVLTDRTKQFFDTPEKWHTRRKHIPRGQIGRPDEIAAPVVFLLSDAARNMTGGVYPVDGGISAAYIIDDRNGSDTP